MSKNQGQSRIRFYGDPNCFRALTPMERLFNRTFGFLVGMGLGFSYNYLLQVRAGSRAGLLNANRSSLHIGELLLLHSCL